LLKKVFILLLILLFLQTQAQETFSFNVLVLEQDEDESEPIAGVAAIVVNANIAAVSDDAGKIQLKNIPAGAQVIEFSMLGYFIKRIKKTFSKTDSTTTIIYLEPKEAELEEIVIATTRSNKRVEENPIAIDVVNAEEMQERSVDKPSSISHAVKEQQGVQVQRTSATSGTFNIRLQGLNGKYTQLLKEGFANFGGLSSGIGIAQIPPLDLKQIEIIKGPASTLYGGDAIAGVVNLVSKQPVDGEPERDLLVNIESTRSVDAGFFFSQKIRWFGFSATGMLRNQRERDWNNDNFVEYPKLQRYYIAPQLYFDVSKNAKINFGANYTFENRLGGTMQYIRKKTDAIFNYFERNISHHAATNLKFEYDFESKGKFTVRNSINYFSRNIELPNYRFKGIQLASVSELSYSFTKNIHSLIAGIDLRTDKFDETPLDTNGLRSYDYKTVGAFALYTLRFKRGTTIEAGMRADYNFEKGFIPLPHLAIMQQWNNVFLTRLNGGMGYKLPTVFQGESEEMNFRNVRALPSNIKPELSAGATLDLQARLPNFDGVNITISQLWFFTHIHKPIVATEQKVQPCFTLDCDELVFSNGNGNIQTKGVETKFQIYYRGFSFSTGYTYTNHRNKLNGVEKQATITAPHQVSLLAGYELFKRFSAGIDAYFFSPQTLSDGAVTKPIWELGINTQLNLKYVLIFANIENVLDIRQSRYGELVKANPTFRNPKFSEIYAPLEGTIFNAGVKVILGNIGNNDKD
jgi:outer membrane receptor for ferrienterochelin and colicins